MVAKPAQHAMAMCTLAQAHIMPINIDQRQSAACLGGFVGGNRCLRLLNACMRGAHLLLRGCTSHLCACVTVSSLPIVASLPEAAERRAWPPLRLALGSWSRPAAMAVTYALSPALLHLCRSNHVHVSVVRRALLSFISRPFVMTTIPCLDTGRVHMRVHPGALCICRPRLGFLELSRLCVRARGECGACVFAHVRAASARTVARLACMHACRLHICPGI